MYDGPNSGGKVIVFTSGRSSNPCQFTLFEPDAIGHRQHRTLPASPAFIGPDCRRPRPCGGLADMETSATDGSDRVPFAAHRKSANRAGRWRTGGLTPKAM